MDYCYACRRHLNGAFSCPGCGTVAERPATPEGAGEGEGADTARLPAVTPEPGTAELPVVSSEGADPPPGEGVGFGMVDPGALADLSDGRTVLRAARHRRRRTAFYGMGAIAVIGALAMFSVTALSGGHSDGSAPAPSGTTTVSPAADTSGAPSPAEATARPSRPGRHTTAPAPPSAPAPEPPSTTPAAHTTTPSGPATTSSPRPTTASPASASPSATATTPASPTPTPSPTKTCTQVLWWCS